MKTVQYIPSRVQTSYPLATTDFSIQTDTNHYTKINWWVNILEAINNLREVDHKYDSKRSATQAP